MVFSETESRGCVEILNALDYEELQSLLDTVVGKQVKVPDRRDAIKAVITHSESPMQLLKRKKIKKDTLFQYLVSNRVAVTATASKADLICAILQKWGSKINDKYLYKEDEDDSTQSGYRSLTSNTSSQASASKAVKPNRVDSFAERRQLHGLAFQATYQRNVQMSVQTEVKIETQSFIRAYSEAASGHIPTTPTPAPTTAPIPATTPTPTRAFSSGHCDSSVTKPELQILGEAFCKWFYENVNSFNPALQQTPADFGPQHFWTDAYLLVSKHTTEVSKERFDGATLTSQKFVAFAKDELLLFNPNIGPEGVFVKSDPYGMVRILVCGTVHRDHFCLGIFQQLFALIRDPTFENNWKIKGTKLSVRSATVTSMPRLDANPEQQIMELEFM